MRLSKKDKQVIERFTDPIKQGDMWLGRDLEGDKLSSDGEKLDWMGGNRIAFWKDDKIHFTDAGSKSVQSVQAAIRKATPKNWLAETGAVRKAKPASKKPASKKPASKKPASKKPASKKPASKKPASKKPASKRPKTGPGRYPANPKAEEARQYMRDHGWSHGEVAATSNRDIMREAAKEAARGSAHDDDEGWSILDELDLRQQDLYAIYGKSSLVALPAGTYTIVMRDSEGETALRSWDGGVYEPESKYPMAGRWTQDGELVLYEEIPEGEAATLERTIFYDREDAEVLSR